MNSDVDIIKYKCIKIQLKDLLKNQDDINVINNAVYRVNTIISKTYMLLRLWLLQKYHSFDETLPLINIDVIRSARLSFLLPSRGKKPKNNNALLINEFRILSSSLFFSLENGRNLSTILEYYSTTMITSIENNVKNNFFNFLKRFINSYFKFIYREEITNKDFKNQLMRELKVVKDDIINNTLKSNIKYHSWISTNRQFLLPTIDPTSNYFYDLKENPQSYLKNLIWMNIQLESIGCKLFQFFPLQSNLTPRHIQIDTSCLIDLFCNQPKQTKELAKNNEYKTELWTRFFILDKYKLKNYIFDFTITTDGYCVSLRFLETSKVEEENTKKENLRIGREECKNLTVAEKKIREKEKAKISKEKRKNNIKPISEVKRKKAEFEYFDDVDKEELIGKHIFIDPGKRSLLSMMDNNGKFSSFTNRKLITRTKRLKYQKHLQKYKNTINISEVENELANYNSKTCNIDLFIQYIIKKLEVNNRINIKYREKKFRQYKFYGYINRKRVLDKMVDSIKKTYSGDHIIIMGDWSMGKSMRHFMPTPNLEIKRKLKENFQLYEIDEFRTSILHNKTEEKCKNMYLPDKKKKMRKMHSILTYQMESRGIGCINRDKNGCKNMKKLFDSYMEKGEIPFKYRRTTRIED